MSHIVHNLLVGSNNKLRIISGMSILDELDEKYDVFRVFGNIVSILSNNPLKIKGYRIDTGRFKQIYSYYSDYYSCDYGSSIIFKTIFRHEKNYVYINPKNGKYQIYILPNHFKNINILPTATNSIIIYQLPNESYRTFHIINPESLSPGQYDFNYLIDGIKQVILPEFQTMFSEETVETIMTGRDNEDKFKTEFNVRGRYILEILDSDLLQAWSWNGETLIPGAITQEDIYQIPDASYSDDEQLISIPMSNRYFGVNGTYNVKANNIEYNITLNDLLLFCSDTNTNFTIDLITGTRIEYKNLELNRYYRYFDEYYTIYDNHIYFQNNLIFDDDLEQYNTYVFKLPISEPMYQFIEKILLNLVPKVVSEIIKLYL